MAKPGTTRNACSILARNANPSRTPQNTSHRVRPFSTARTSAYAAAVISSTSSASGLLNLNIRAATGVSARTSPATSPAAGPNQRRTAAYSSADRGHALQCLRHQHRPLVEAEHPAGQLHDPQRGRRLVHGDEVGRSQTSRRRRPSSSWCPPGPPPRRSRWPSRSWSGPTGRAARSAPPARAGPGGPSADRSQDRAAGAGPGSGVAAGRCGSNPSSQTWSRSIGCLPLVVDWSEVG